MVGTAWAVPEAVFSGHDAAVAEDGELVAQGNLGDADGANPVGLGARVEDVGQRGEDGIVVAGVGAQLGNGLRNQHIEPVEALGQVALDVVVRFGEDGGNAGPAAALFGLADDAARRLVLQRERERVGPRLERLQRLLVGEGAGTAQRVQVQGAVVGRGRVAEDEELDEAEDEQGNGELAEEEALDEGEPADVSSPRWQVAVGSPGR